MMLFIRKLFSNNGHDLPQRNALHTALSYKVPRSGDSDNEVAGGIS